jgi:hypothetical protein
MCSLPGGSLPIQRQRHAFAQEATNFSLEILGQVLALLVKAKVLINEEKDQYDLNLGESRLVFPSVLRCEYGR